MCVCVWVFNADSVILFYRDLSQNDIASLTASTPWPKPSVLQTLVLDENPISLIEETAFSSLRSLQYL